MEQLILVVHVLMALAIIGLILLQQGKGAEAGASFGAGASQTVFGSAGSGNFLTRATAICATLFFLTSFALAVVAKNAGQDVNALDIPVVVEQNAPASDVPALDDVAAEESAADLPPAE